MFLEKVLCIYVEGETTRDSVKGVARDCYIKKKNYDSLIEGNQNNLPRIRLSTVANVTKALLGSILQGSC